MHCRVEIVCKGEELKQKRERTAKRENRQSDRVLQLTDRISRREYLQVISMGDADAEKDSLGNEIGINRAADTTVALDELDVSAVWGTSVHTPKDSDCRFASHLSRKLN